MIIVLLVICDDIMALTGGGCGKLVMFMILIFTIYR
jgi:hypothetical protein